MQTLSKIIFTSFPLVAGIKDFWDGYYGQYGN